MKKNDDSVTRFPACKRRLLAEDHTLQHPRGTAERLTLRHWFSVNSVSTMRRKVVEQQGEWVQSLEMLKNVSLGLLRSAVSSDQRGCTSAVERWV